MEEEEGWVRSQSFWNVVQPPPFPTSSTRLWKMCAVVDCSCLCDSAPCHQTHLSCSNRLIRFPFLQLLSVAAEASTLHVTHPNRSGVFLPVTNNVRQEQIQVQQLVHDTDIWLQRVSSAQQYMSALASDVHTLAHERRSAVADAFENVRNMLKRMEQDVMREMKRDGKRRLAIIEAFDKSLKAVQQPLREAKELLQVLIVNHPSVSCSTPLQRSNLALETLAASDNAVSNVKQVRRSLSAGLDFRCSAPHS